MCMHICGLNEVMSLGVIILPPKAINDLAKCWDQKEKLLSNCWSENPRKSPQNKTIYAIAIAFNCLLEFEGKPYCRIHCILQT